MHSVLSWASFRSGRLTALVILSCLTLTAPSDSACAVDDTTKSGDQSGQTNPPIGELIDQLVEVSEQGIGYHATAWTSGFMGGNEEPEFGGGVLGSQQPATSPVMKQLVQRGVEALPELIAHLTDMRETKLVVGGDIIMFAWFGTDYDS
ncbi:MAG: hypothetical protein KDD44_13570, partial [Bdellovibrionales bacterium]|nr:hypothetical protein [Bdellovibrionales bacterium]